MTNKDTEAVIHIGARLKEARELAGLSQGQVAKMLGLHRPAVSGMEAGNRKVSTDELRQLSEIYDVGIDWLLGSSAGSIEPDDPRLELAARELAKLKSDDLGRLLKLISAMRTEPADNDEGKA